mmetsp:Transcript_42525/g.83783  ORF Transcript_42525/g.83783 Transcript_42525/m.83783 type:complete len:247 (-) Transcript_42525:697-1437(-)
MVSPTCLGVGATAQIMSTFEDPTRLSWSKNVNLLLRKGMWCLRGCCLLDCVDEGGGGGKEAAGPPCGCSAGHAFLLTLSAFFDVNAVITSPSAARLLLIALASFSRSPTASVLATRSDPAKSTKWSRLTVVTFLVFFFLFAAAAAAAMTSPSSSYSSSSSSPLSRTTLRLQPPPLLPLLKLNCRVLTSEQVEVQIKVRMAWLRLDRSLTLWLSVCLRLAPNASKGASSASLRIRTRVTPGTITRPS